MSELKILESGCDDSQKSHSDNGLLEKIEGLKPRLRNNKMLLINTPQIIFSNFNLERAENRGYQAYHPLGLQCLSAAIADRDVDVSILDMNFEFLKGAIEGNMHEGNWMDFLREKVDTIDPSIVGVSSMYDMFQPNFMKILKYLEGEGRVVLTGGPSATYRAQKLVDRNLADFACSREAEGQIRTIVDNLFEFENPKSPVSGIVFKKDDQVKATGFGKDNLQYRLHMEPQHQKLPIGEYYKYSTLGPMQTMAGKDIPFATLQVARGCRYDCDFCCVNDLNGRGLRMRPLEDIIGEISFLYDTYGTEVDGKKSFYIEFVDDDLGGIGNQELISLANSISQIPRNLGFDDGRINYGVQNGLVAVHLDEAVLQTLNNTGCIGWKVGIESGNDEMLKAMRKPGRLAGFEKFSERKKQYAPDTSVGFNYIIGTVVRDRRHDDEVVRETFGQMVDSFRFAREYNTDWGSFSIFQDSKTDDIIEDETASSSRTASKGSLSSEVKKGVDIFTIGRDEILSQEQLKEVWRTFDFLTNYVYNPRIVDKQEKMFIRYATSVRENYPTEIGVPLYLGLVHQSIGDYDEAQKNIEAARTLYSRGYTELVDLFGLDSILYNFPKNAREAQDVLSGLREKYKDYGNE